MCVGSLFLCEFKNIGINTAELKIDTQKKILVFHSAATMPCHIIVLVCVTNKVWNTKIQI